MQLCHHNKGGALISALFITAIAAILATALAMSQRFLVNEAQLITRSDSLYLQLQGEQLVGVSYIENYLDRQAANSQITDTFISLKNNLPVRVVSAIKLNGIIEDEQGKYNINNLVYSANQLGFAILLRVVVPSISKETAMNIAKSITAWETNGSQDAYYLSLHPAYRSSQHEMVDISELRLIAGITPKIYAAIAPYVTALPVDKPSTATVQSQPANPQETFTPVNLNSASAPVFMALNPGLSFAKASSLVACRKGYGGFNRVVDFLSRCGDQFGLTMSNNLVAHSQYYKVLSQAQLKSQQVMLKSLLVTERQKNNKLGIRIVWQVFE